MPYTAVITNPDGQAVSFTWDWIPAPTISGVSPTSGPASGGTVVTITGTGFRAGATVLFGGVAASNVFVSPDGTSITCTAPAQP